MKTYIKSVDDLKFMYGEGADLFYDSKQITAILFKTYVPGSALIVVIYKDQTANTIVNWNNIYYYSL